MKKQSRIDDGTCRVPIEVVAFHLSEAASKAGRPMADEVAFSKAFVELTARRETQIEKGVASLNSSPDALAEIEAARQLGTFDQRLAMADHAVSYNRAGFTSAESILLGRAKLAQMNAERANEFHRVANIIKARATGTPVTATQPKTTQPSTTTRTPAPVTTSSGNGTFQRVGGNQKTPAVRRVEPPIGMSVGQILDLAQRGQLPLRDVARPPNAVMTTAKRLLKEAREAGDRDFSWETACANAFSIVHAKKAAT